jgi:hypothetical protein
MAQNVPSTILYPPFSIETLSQKSKAGAPMDIAGLLYAQYGASTVIASSTTETTLFLATPGTTSVGSLFMPAKMLALHSTENDQNRAGTIIQGHIWGTIKNNTSTPLLTITAGITNAAGTYTALTTNSGVTMVSTPTAYNLDIHFQFQVLIYGTTTGSIGALGEYNYFPTTTTYAPVPLAWAATTIDTTVEYTIDAHATFDAGHANNAIAIKGATVYVLN